ncbi:hypothetical protein [Tengunoibacter tsumagoiensis]|uniref:Uncharacterized protein n=1 Tax=Tengunoibacter tsumagoiensis TaxID=2014871 RepID=A0A402A9C9_9CHLR|nr:hypothetical protein [Tengunoibacter tsumagoiensis]GCE15565.1 hypothetical protein KTT_54240 [Tengunoibacter tsumagoiensis]
MSIYDTSDWDFFCCFPKGKHTAEASNELLKKLKRLWAYGLHFYAFKLSQENWPATWEEQLLSTGKIITAKSPGLSGSFSWCIEHLLESNGGLIGMSYGVAFIDLDPYFLLSNPYLDWMHIGVRGIDAAAKRDKINGDNYLAVQQSFVSCCKLVCEIFEPLFGFGNKNAYLENDISQFRLLRNEGQELLQGTLPPIDEWFYEPPLRYVAPSLVTSELTMSYLSHQHWQVERLSTNGLFVTPTYPEYTYSGYSALHYLAKGKTDVRAARRALEIFETIGDKENVRRADSLIPE